MLENERNIINHFHSTIKNFYLFHSCRNLNEFTKRKAILFLTTVSECTSVNSVAFLLRLSSLLSKILFYQMKFMVAFSLSTFAWPGRHRCLLFFHFSHSSSFRPFAIFAVWKHSVHWKLLAAIDMTNRLLKIINAQIMWKYRKLISLTYFINILWRDHQCL